MTWQECHLLLRHFDLQFEQSLIFFLFFLFQEPLALQIFLVLEKNLLVSLLPSLDGNLLVIFLFICNCKQSKSEHRQTGKFPLLSNSARSFDRNRFVRILEVKERALTHAASLRVYKIGTRGGVCASACARARFIFVKLCITCPLEESKMIWPASRRNCDRINHGGAASSENVQLPSLERVHLHPTSYGQYSSTKVTHPQAAKGSAEGVGG